MDDENIVSKALTKQEALEAIKFYCLLKVPILGGDVFFLNQKGEIGWTYDNWYFEKNKGESNHEYLDRSISQTECFIKNYSNNSFEDCIFLFDIVYAKNDKYYGSN